MNYKHYRLIEKAAALSKNDQEPSAVRDVAKGVAGGMILGKSIDSLIGAKKIYHGTSKEKWKKIKVDGLKPSRKSYSKASSFVKRHMKNVNPPELWFTNSKLLARKAAKASGGSGGKVVTVKIPFIRFTNRNFHMTPGMNSEQFGIRDPLGKYFSTRTFKPEFFSNDIKSRISRGKILLKALPKYIRRHPGRFVTGAGGTSLGAWLLYNGLLPLVKNNIQKEDQKK